MAYERARQRLAPTSVFIGRVLTNLLVVLVLVAASLAVGMWGYHTLEGEPWIDAFADASMILSGMGPLNPLQNDQAKLFAGAYALYSGLFLVAAAGLILSPVLHRILHRMHAADEDENPPET
ncbi:MAG TPA: hypothetical protein PLV04_06125 [Phenylobacterium sp.]|nr:hypothetical protein [Phenylobacterium sp.]HQN49800.1 hypothetical protein [Phenylobacterium sp.]